MTDTARPTPPSPQELLMREFAEQGLTRSQAAAALAALPPASYEAASQAALNRWLDTETARAQAAYDASPEGRLAAAEAESARITAEREEHANLIEQAETILSTAGLPDDWKENLSDLDKLRAVGLAEKPDAYSGHMVPDGSKMIREGNPS